MRTVYSHGTSRWRLKNLCLTTTTDPPTESQTPNPSLNPSKTLTNFLCNLSWHTGYPFLYFYNIKIHITRFIKKVGFINQQELFLLSISKKTSKKNLKKYTSTGRVVVQWIHCTTGRVPRHHCIQKSPYVETPKTPSGWRHPSSVMVLYQYPSGWNRFLITNTGRLTMWKDNVSESCLLWIKKVRVKDKTYVWVSVWWKTKNEIWEIHTPRIHWVDRGTGRVWWLGICSWSDIHQYRV
jgi:hypothetical protein